MATRATMATAALPARRGAAAFMSPAGWTALAMFAAAFLIRLPSFGDPAFDIDEEFYLLAGDRMLHGALPYVDIWDRKPIGLFVVYAAIRLLGGNGILAYQLVAAAFAGVTGFLIAGIVRPRAHWLAAAAAGLAYIVWIETTGGGGGQSPVFYNALVAGAAWATLGTLREGDPRRVWRRGLCAMVLVGIGIQIKYTVLFEGMFFGLVLAWRLLATAGWRGALWRSACLAGIALAPTAAALAFYAAIGHAHDFVFANFTSIALRAPGRRSAMLARLWIEVQHATPLAVCAAASAWQILRTEGREGCVWLAFVGGWMVAALIGFASVGAFFFHYMLPLYVPLAVAAAPIFPRLPIGPVLAGVALWIPFSNLDYPDFASSRRTREGFDRLLAALPPDVGTRCIYVNDGPPSLYLLGHACATSRFVFPDHLSSLVEAKAIGVDPVAETRRILAARPAAIVISTVALPNRNPATFALVRAAIAQDYRFAARMSDEERIALYVRR